MTDYIFDNAAPQTEDRFDILRTVYDPISTARLSALGIRPGWRCLEVGGGSGSVAGWLADRVGPRGSVVVTDIDLSRLDCAADGIEIRRHDIVADELPTAEFDLVHIRLVLGLLPGRFQALDRIFAALKPGGLLVLDEFDCSYLPVFHAPNPEAVTIYATVTAAIHQLIEDRGGDHIWSNHALAVLRHTGFHDVEQHAYSESWRGGCLGIGLHRANAVQVRAEMIAKGLVTEAEFDRFIALLDDPDLVVNSYLMHTISARRPTVSNGIRGGHDVAR